MNINPIKTNDDYHAALKEIENLMMAELDSPEGEKLDVMVTLVEAYEAKHFPIDSTIPRQHHLQLMPGIVSKGLIEIA